MQVASEPITVPDPSCARHPRCVIRRDQCCRPPTRRHNPHSGVGFDHRCHTRRGFLPGALSNAYPSHRGPREVACARGQASDKPKPERSLRLVAREAGSDWARSFAVRDLNDSGPNHQTFVSRRCVRPLCPPSPATRSFRPTDGSRMSPPARAGRRHPTRCGHRRPQSACRRADTASLSSEVLAL